MNDINKLIELLKDDRLTIYTVVRITRKTAGANPNDAVRMLLQENDKIRMSSPELSELILNWKF